MRVPDVLSWSFVGAVAALGVMCGLGGAAFTLLLNGVELYADSFPLGVRCAQQADRRFRQGAARM